MSRNHLLLLAAFAAGSVALLVSQQPDLFPVLPAAALLGRQSDTTFLVATNQLLRPWGEQTRLTGRPVDLAFDSNKRLLAVLNTRGVHLLDGSTGAPLHVLASKSTSYCGLAFRPGDREIWASEATRDGPDSLLVGILSENGSPQEVRHLALPGHPVPTGIAFSTDGLKAYVALSGNNTLAVIDTDSKTVIREIPVGMVPYGVVISASTKRIFVSNRGGRRPKTSETTAYSATAAVVTDPETGATSTGTVSVLDLETFNEQQVEVGLAPAGMALSPDGKTLAIANAHSDSITLMDTATLKTSTLRVPVWPEQSFGATPSSVTFSGDGRQLYAAAGGVNAVIAYGFKGGKWSLEGAIPTPWFPTVIRTDREQALRVLSVKGMGSTEKEPEGRNSRQFEGAVSVIPKPGPPQLQAGLREARAASEPRFTPAGGVSDLAALGIEHVFLIIKENRTYDQVFADMPRGNREPKFLMYGREVTPNHHALAEQYVLFDNFYTGGAISFDGHQWLMMAFVSDYVEHAFAASPRGYAWNMADALTVAPTGFFWQGAPRPLDVRLYGAFSLPARWDPAARRAIDINEEDLLPWPEYWRMYKAGTWREAVGARSGVPALQKFYASQYPNSSMNIPDQIRADAYLEELAAFEKSGRLPNLSIFTMTSDHTMGTRPDFPTPRAMVADNDLAMGRIVAGISKSRFWPKSLILITEDDAQDGLDHVDGRRTIALLVGPHVRRGQLDSNHYNHSSMIRTIQQVFRIPPRTRYLSSARAMNSAFQAKPDPQPYGSLTPKVPLDEMNPPLKALNGRRRWAARQSLTMNSHEVDDIPHDLMNRILWWDARGYEAEYPERRSAARGR